MKIRPCDSARRATLQAVALCIVMMSVPLAAVADASLEVFTRPGCPHCLEAREFLQELVKERADLAVVEHDVTRDDHALERLRDLTAGAGIATPGVPTFVLAGEVIVGFDPEATPAKLRALLDEGRRSPEVGSACTAEPSACEARGVKETPTAIRVPLIGQIEMQRVGLPLFTLAVGLLDGFNPCATWVLLFLLAMLLNLNSRPRMALIAGTFVLVSGIVYFAFMAAWLTFFMVVGVSHWLRFVLAALALGIGALNVKDFLAPERGPSLSIPQSAKPGLYKRIREVLEAQNLAAAMAGIVALAFVVNLVELLCTAGLPALYTAILTEQMLPPWQYYGYLALYIFAYMLDDSILVTIGVVTLGKRKLQERGGQLLKLLSGVVIIALGIVLLVRPGWLGM
jgi:glutaredoxin